jgi:ketosteroid isomerase-like protein
MRHLGKRGAVGHQNEAMLEDLYAEFASSDIDGFFSGCTDEVTVTVPGNASVSGNFTKARFRTCLPR